MSRQILPEVSEENETKTFSLLCVAYRSISTSPSSPSLEVRRVDKGRATLKRSATAVGSLFCPIYAVDQMSGGSSSKYTGITAEHTADRLTADDSGWRTLNKYHPRPLIRQVLGDIMRRAPRADYRHFAPPTGARGYIFARMENGTQKG